MKEAMLIQLPCNETHLAWLREAAGDRCRLLFPGEPGALAEATCVFGEPTLEEIAAMPRLRWIQMSWAGADRYTAAPDFPRNIQVCCATGAYGGVIAEYLFGAILALYRHLPTYVRQMDSGLWRPRFPGRGIEGKTVLILGAGDIGTAFAKRLRPFGARVLGVRRTAGACPPEYDEMHTLDHLPALLPRADIVSCSLPNTVETRGLLDEAALRSMKPDALLLNVGRGTLLNPDVLAKVLASGHLSGAALDVCEPEPLPPGHPLWAMDNVLLTPHIAGIGFGNVPETAGKIVRLCCRNLRRLLDGEPLESRVDFATGYREPPKKG